MKRGFLWSLIWSLCLAGVICVNDNDDIAFDEAGEANADREISNVVPVHRVWGLPDVQAIAGKLFILSVPSDAFEGDIDYYEASVKNSEHHEEWPKWLEFEKKGVFRGVPMPSDAGINYISITAVGPSALYKSKDVFAIEVVQPGLDVRLSGSEIRSECPGSVDPIFLTILLSAKIGEINEKTRVSILKNIAGYFGLKQDKFYLHQEKSSKDLWSFSDTSYFIEGPGHAHNKTSQTEFTGVSFQIGCGKKVGSEFKPLIEKIKTEAVDGTLSEVLLNPVLGWHAKNEVPMYFRGRRQVGSGDQYEEDEDDEDDYNEPITTTPSPHPHRHHHGEDLDFANQTALSPSEVQYRLPSTSLLIDYDEDLISTPMFIPSRPTERIEPTKVFDQDYFTMTASVSPRTINEVRGEDNLPHRVTIPYLYSERTSSGDSQNMTNVTSDPYGTTNFTEQSSSDFLTTDSLKTFNASPRVNVSTSVTTDEIEPQNFRPSIAHRLKKVAATAGKVLRFKIPENTFADIEDGSTRHMRLSFRTQEGRPVASDSWIKFDVENQEILAIPLEEHVSKWEFEVKATDKDGDSVSDVLSLQIQHHKGHRAVNFEFSADLVLTSNWSSAVDWQNNLVAALVKVYNDVDSSQITVRSVSRNRGIYSFSWTNDTLPRSYCPRNDIDALYKVIAHDDGDVTDTFRKALTTGISVKRISILGIGQCESKSGTTTPLTPKNPHTNFSPVPRNQIDQVNATAGCLLVFKVPEDTCYDPEDGSTRKLKVSLLNMDRTPLDPNQWLQFDTKNQEFYGVPMDADVKSQEYQLVCEDREGLTANDGLIVVVRPRPSFLYSVEFTIAVDVLYESFLNSSSLKRKFIEKLQQLFRDPTTDSIVLGSVSEGSTIITWYNRSLPTHVCPTEDIHKLRELLINDDESMNERLVAIMGHEFPVISVGLEPAGTCQGELTVLHKPESPPPPFEENLFPVGVTEDYLFTFVIPAILIALMLILAGIIACLFYRKRRASKMGIGDHDENHSFRSKGIPVIFQDELDEKPEPENKCPVIMKEEKPPLPPPEYQRSHLGIASAIEDLNEDAPYQPPPPFTSAKETGRNSRPKPTPTYRKPPPYVPP